MLDLNSELTTYLQKSSKKAIFLVRLYYGNQSNFTGISTSNFTDGSDFYAGAIASMSDISYDLDFFKFAVAQHGITLKVVNTPIFDNAKKFSDLAGTNAYENRRYEIYVIPSDESLTKEILAYGTISGDFQYDEKFISIKLNDFRNQVSVGLPQTIIREDDTSNAFQFAPEENFNKPIPILYGDHSHNTAFDDSVSNLTVGSERWATRSKVPAILVNEFEASKGGDNNSNKAVALVDTEAVHTLNSNTVYFYNNDLYSAIEPSNVSVDASISKVKFVGSEAYALIPLIMDTDISSSFSRDKFEETTFDVTITDTSQVELFNLGVPDVSQLGTIKSNGIQMYILGVTASGTEPPRLQVEIGGSAATTEDVANTTRSHLFDDSNNTPADITSSFTSSQKESWDFATEIKLLGRIVSASGTLNIDQAWLEVYYEVNDPISRIGYVEQLEHRSRYVYNDNRYEEDRYETVKSTFVLPKDIKVVYVSGKGRKFGSWVDGSRGSPGNSFNSGDLIEHPVYIIEEILRTELGLGDSNINMVSFDTVATATSSYKCAFSQYQKILAFDLIDDICKQFGMYFFFNGEGKATLVNKKLTSAYSSADYTIDFEDCFFKGVKKTSVNQIKSKIRIEYDFDYGMESNRLNIETSSPNNSDWNRDKALTLAVDCNKIRFDVEASSLANAKALATTIHDLYKDNHQTRKNVVMLSILNMAFLKCEVGDIVDLNNVPSEITLYGTAISSQKFMITKISKSDTKIDVELTQVS